MMRKHVMAVMMAAAAAMVMAGCSGNSSEASKGTETAKTEAAGTQEAGTAPEAESYTIGIGQFAEHGSLDNCRTGFLQGLEKEGFKEGENLTVLYENAQTDGGTSSQIMDNFLAKNE